MMMKLSGLLSKYKPTDIQHLPSIYIFLPLSCLLLFLLILLLFVLPVHLELTQALKQHKLLLNDKRSLEADLHKVKHKLSQLQDMDKHFTDLIAKYHFPWQSISWLSHLQSLMPEHTDNKNTSTEAGIELQRIKLIEHKKIKLTNLDNQVTGAQFIDVELKADYTRLIYWLLALAEQPALLSIERLLLTESSTESDKVQANMLLVIYYPDK